MTNSGVTTRGDGKLKRLITLAQVILCALVIALSTQIIILAKHNQSIQQDLAEVSDIKYGLFSVNKWRDRLSQIVNREIAKIPNLSEKRRSTEALD